MFNKEFKKDILTRLDNIEERLSSDRRAIPVLKDVVNILKKENADLRDRLMARSFEEYKVYKYSDDDAGPTHFGITRLPEDLSADFAGEVLDFDKTLNKMVEP
jgi:regulator of replication initiation timing